MFRYSSYWGIWRRVLRVDVTRGSKEYVEVNLTPVNGWDSRDGVESVRSERVIRHATPRARGDRVVRELPVEVKADMVSHLGHALAGRLLTHDYGV